MSFNLTFFALDIDGTERTLSRTTIPEGGLIVYQSAPGIALSIAQAGADPKPDGFRITDNRGHIKITFSQSRQSTSGDPIT